jgi:hypothetical protein
MYMKNTHLQHPEDSILNGNLSVLNWFLSPGNLSVKVDGAPAIVWGTHPENGKFFVGTKSVFNKKKIKICYNQEDIFALYDEATHASLIKILCACLKYLPQVNGIYQGDFIGFGGSKEYTPNTITYQFSEVVWQNIIMAPHTFYFTETTMQDAEAHPLINSLLYDTNDVKFVQPNAHILHGQDVFYDVEEVCNFARQMATTCEFVYGKELANLKIALNACIREGREIGDYAFDCDPNLIRFWKLVKSIKEDCLYLCRNNGPTAYIGNKLVDGEGYVMINEYGIYKLVRREVFSHYNFNLQKNW